MDKLRVLVIDDHPLMRLGVRELLHQRWPEAEIEEAEDIRSALSWLSNGSWDCAVVDLSLPDSSGLEGLVKLRRAASAVPLLVLSMHGETAYASRALQLGASGYLTKEHATAELIKAVERVRSGGRYISADLADRLAGMLAGDGAPQLPHEALSQQEYRVMVQIAAGRTASEIADSMHLSVKTVGTYRARIIDKTGLGNTAEIARYCAAHGLIEPH